MDNPPNNKSGGMDLKAGDGDDRLGFIKKVYAILFVQLAITAAFSALAITQEDMANWIYENWWLELIFAIFAIVIEIALICNRKLARTVPANYIALLIFTLCETYIVSFFCVYYTWDPITYSFNPDGYRTVGVALAMTVAVVASATTYAWTTKTDFTRKMGFIWVLAITFMMLGFMSIFFYSYFLQMFLCALGTLIFGIYLIFDT